MNEPALRTLLEAVAAGTCPPAAALQQLKHFSLEDLGRIQLDHHRALRTGFPEVIYGAGKSLGDLQTIAMALIERGQPLLMTRITQPQATVLQEQFPDLAFDSAAGILYSPAAAQPTLGVGVLVLAAGTADVPVAAEAARIAELSGCSVDIIWDCGVAGIHRLTAQAALLEAADLLIVVAGMEGALPSVVGGLTDTPLIALPTSTGYGTGLAGYSAMLTMLNTCAAGSVVVNIDNGFGAGYFAGLLARQMARRRDREHRDAAL